MPENRNVAPAPRRETWPTRGARTTLFAVLRPRQLLAGSDSERRRARAASTPPPPATGPSIRERRIGQFERMPLHTRLTTARCGEERRHRAEDNRWGARASSHIQR